MKRKRTLAALMVVMTVLAPALGGVAIASDTIGFGGGTASTADAVNHTDVQVGSTLSNVTIQMTEDQSGSTSYFYTTNVTPTGVDANASSGTISGTNIVDDGVYVNTSATGDTVAHVNITFNVSDNVSSDGSVPDAINVTQDNAMEDYTQLVADPDSSEVHDYRVYGDDNGDMLDWDVSVDNGEINESTDEYVPNSTGDAQFTIEVTRNNTTYENLSLESQYVHVSFDNSGFAEISEETNETAGRLILKTDGIGDFVDDGDEDKGYKFSLVEQNNTTRTYTLKFNVTVENADENKSILVESVHDPKGGAQASAGTAYGLHNLGDTSEFLNIPLDASNPLTLALGALAVVLVVGGIAYASDMQSGLRGYGAYGTGGYTMMGMNILWLAAILAGLSMVVGPFIGLTFWDSILVEGMGLPSWSTMVLGLALSLGGAALAVRKNLER